ncbi:MAG: TonB family protein [Pseudomonadales bacterium]|nr:TonB family protein [Pseudomonadales bacterium]MBO7007951.1 TonB family protein [Pseudomonadales bacterium]
MNSATFQIVLSADAIFQNAFRVVTPVVGAASVTTLLFYLMMLLIKSEEIALAPDSIKITEFVRVPEPRELLITRPEAKEPEQPVTPPPTPNLSFDATRSTYDVGGELVVPDVGKALPTGYTDGAFLPLVKVQPIYPRRAQSRGIEGYTVVEFDVGPDGSVRNPRVIDYHPNTVFNATSINAVLKFRYKPKVENGTPVEVVGVQNRFTFELTQD